MIPLSISLFVNFSKGFTTQVKLADLVNNTDPKRASGLNEARRKKYELAKRVLGE